MNKTENPGVSRRGAAMLLLFSLAVSVLLGFAMPVHAADGGRTTLRTLRVGFYPYTGYMATAADGSRSGLARRVMSSPARIATESDNKTCITMPSFPFCRASPRHGPNYRHNQQKVNFQFVHIPYRSVPFSTVRQRTYLCPPGVNTQQAPANRTA